MKTKLIDRKKVNFKSKSSGFKSKSFFKLKFQRDYTVTVVRKYSECFTNVLKLRISFSLEILNERKIILVQIKRTN